MIEKGNCCELIGNGLKESKMNVLVEQKGSTQRVTRKGQRQKKLLCLQISNPFYKIKSHFNSIIFSPPFTNKIQVNQNGICLQTLSWLYEPKVNKRLQCNKQNIIIKE